MFNEGRSFVIFPLKVTYLSLTKDGSFLQVAFGVSTKNFRRATDRNRVKRLMKEAYRIQKIELEASVIGKNLRLLLFFNYTGKDLPNYAEITSKVSLTLKRLQKIIDENYSPGT